MLFSGIVVNILLYTSLQSIQLKVLGNNTFQSNGYPPKGTCDHVQKACWSVERMWAENPTTIQTRIKD